MPRRGEHSIKDGIPEKQLEQHRDILHDFDVYSGQLGNQPVTGQAGDPDKGPEDDRYYNPDKGDPQGIQHAHQERPGIGVCRRVRNQRFTDLKCGFLVQKPKSSGDALFFEVSQGVGNQVPGKQSEQDQDNQLRYDRPFLGVKPKRDFFNKCTAQRKQPTFAADRYS